MQRRGFSLIDKKLSKLRGFELRLISDILGYLYNTLSAALWFEASVLGFWNFTQWKKIYCRCATSRFQFDRSQNVEIIGYWTWDILGNLYSKERLRVYCDVMRTTLCGPICKGHGVKKTLWERRCEKEIVRKTLWERRCEKDVLRKTL